MWFNPLSRDCFLASILHPFGDVMLSSKSVQPGKDDDDGPDENFCSFFGWSSTPLLMLPVIIIIVILIDVGKLLKLGT